MEGLQPQEAIGTWIFAWRWERGEVIFVIFVVANLERPMPLSPDGGPSQVPPALLMRRRYVRECLIPYRLRYQLPLSPCIYVRSLRRLDQEHGEGLVCFHVPSQRHTTRFSCSSYERLNQPSSRGGVSLHPLTRSPVS